MGTRVVRTISGSKWDQEETGEGLQQLMKLQRASWEASDLTAQQAREGIVPALLSDALPLLQVKDKILHSNHWRHPTWSRLWLWWLCLLYRWENWGPGKRSSLPKVPAEVLGSHLLPISLIHSPNGHLMTTKYSKFTRRQAPCSQWLDPDQQCPTETIYNANHLSFKMF